MDLSVIFPPPAVDSTWKHVRPRFDRDNNKKKRLLATMLFRQKVVYCGPCGMPLEYCEYSPDFESHCRPWVLKSYPALFQEMGWGDDGDGDGKGAATTDKPSRPSEPWTLQERLTAFYEKYEPTKVSIQTKETTTTTDTHNRNRFGFGNSCLLLCCLSSHLMSPILCARGVCFLCVCVWFVRLIMYRSCWKSMRERKKSCFKHWSKSMVQNRRIRTI